MTCIPISEAAIQNRIKFIFDIINDTSNPEPLEQRLNHAWHEIFGMQFILSIADTLKFCDAKSQREFEEIRKSLAAALADVEWMYDYVVDMQHPSKLKLGKD